MNVNDWIYMNEGGANVIFQYQPNHIPNNVTTETTTTIGNHVDSNISHQHEFVDDESINHEWKFHILRIPKMFLANISSSYINNYEKQQQQQQQQQQQFKGDVAMTTSVDAFEVMLIDRLDPYIDKPKRIEMEWDFLYELRGKVLRNQQVSSFRIKDWNMNHQNETSRTGTNNSTVCGRQNTGRIKPYGFLLPDYRYCRFGTTTRIPYSLHFVELNRFCLEIKPKGGYRATSPFIDNRRLQKLIHSRYVLQQEQYASKVTIRDWMMTSSQTREEDCSQLHILPILGKEETASVHTGSIQKSSYDPIDLFSNNIDSLRMSLHCLFDNPQNNFKIWYGTNLIYGSNTASQLQQLHPIFNNTIESYNNNSSHTVSAYADPHVTIQISDPKMYKPNNTSLQATTNAINNNETTQTTVSSATKQFDDTVRSGIVDIASTILLTEPFLRKIHQFQRYDIIDGDGAILIYNHLVQLCNNDYTLANTMIDSVPLLLGNESNRTTTVSIHPLLDGCPFQPPKEYKTIQAICNVIEKYARILQECFPSVPDADIIQTKRDRATQYIPLLSMDECCYLLQVWLLSLTMCDISFFVSLAAAATPTSPPPNRLQSTTEPGILQFANHIITYSIKVIDYAKKPSTKLRSRLEKEMKFNSIH